MFSGSNSTGKNLIRRMGACLLAFALVVTSINLSWATLSTKAASFTSGGKFLISGSRFAEAYQNLDSGNVSITGGSFYLDIPSGTTVDGSVAIYVNPSASDPASGTSVGSGTFSVTAAQDGIQQIPFSLSAPAVLASMESAAIVVSLGNVAGAATQAEFYTDDSISDGWIYDGGWQGCGHTIEPVIQQGGDLPEAIASFSPSTIYLAPGQTYQLRPTFTPAYNRTVAYSSSVNSVASVNESTGLITAESAGDSIISVSGTGVSASSGTVTVKVVSASISPQTYTGAPITTAPSFSSAIPPTSYRVQYSSNTDVGTASATITGSGNYSMYMTTINFDINPGSISSIYNARNVSLDSYEINTRTSKVTSFSFTSNGKQYTLANGDFSATAKLNTKISGNPYDTYVYNVTLKGLNNLEGEVTAPVSITGAAIDISSVYSMKVNKNSVNYGTANQPPVDPKTFVTFRDAETGEPIQGIPENVTVSYSPSTVGPGSEPGEYKVVATSSLYTGSLESSFKITRSISTGVTVSLDKETWVYTGEAITPTPSVSLGGKLLDPSTDYDVKYSGNYDVGIGTVAITGKGLYTGTRRVNFNIVSNVADSAEVLIDNYYTGNPSNNFNTGYTAEYTGEAIKPENISVYLDGEYLAEGYYQVSYGENINVGARGGSIKITLGEDYGNQELTAYFAIGAYTLQNSDIRVTGLNLAEYESYAIYDPDNRIILPSIDEGKGFGYEVYANTGVGGASKKLNIISDYSVTFENNDKAGLAYVVITGQGNYKGEARQAYRIYPKTLDDGEHYIFPIDPVSYTGSKVTPDVHVYCNTTVIPSSNYDVSYVDNLNVNDNPRVIVKGKENYTGTLELGFDIVPKTIQGSNITYKIGTINAGEGNNAGTGNPGSIDSTFTQQYTGSAIKPAISVMEDGTSLVAYRDYRISYLRNTNVAFPNQAVAVIDGMGNYEGKMEITFGISQRPLTSSGVVINTTGTGLNAQGFPNVEIKDTINGITKTLKPDTDYQVSYGTASATIPGEYKGVITGRGNYSSSVEFEFIIGNPLSQCDIYWMNQHNRNEGLPHSGDYEKWDEGKEMSVNYIGNATPLVRILTPDKDDITRDCNITYTPSNTYNGGQTITVTVDGTSLGYYGTIERKYNITKRQLSDSDLRPEDFVFTINGVEKANGSGSLVLNYDITGEVVSNPSLKVVYNPLDRFAGLGNYINAAPIDVSDDFILEGQNGAAASIDLTNEGTGTLVIRARGASANFSGTRTVTYKVAKVSLATDPRVSIEAIEDQPYNGGEQVRPEVSVKFDGQTLIPGSDYEISGYSDNTEAGNNAKVTITGLGRFKDSKTATFKISKAPFTSSNVKIEAISDKDYTGENITPSIVVTRNGEVLDAAKDYDVAITDNKDPGKATVTVTGKGNYDGGVVKTTFNIVADISSDVFTLSGVDSTNGYIISGGVLKTKDTTGRPLSDTIALTNTKNGKSLTKGTDFTYTTTSMDFPGTSGQVTVLGQAPYYKGVKTVSTIPVFGDINDASWIGKQSYYTFDGINPQEPNPRMQYNGVDLHVNTDYDIDNYTGSNKPGAGSITIVGKNLYTGTKTMGYNIWFDLSRAEISGLNTSYPYNQEVQKYAPVVKIGNYELNLGTDYTTTYNSTSDGAVCKKAGVVTVTINPKDGHSTNSKSKNYSITALTGGETKINPATLPPEEYTGKDIKPVPSSVTYTVGGQIYVLTPDDYTIVYENNREAGEGKVIVQPKGNFSGRAGTATFTINPKNIATGAVIDMREATYTGSPITPSFMITDKDTGMMIPSSMYTISPSTVTTATTHKITFTGKGGGNYTGSVEVEFIVNPLSLNSGKVSLTSNEETYTGETITPDVKVQIPDSTGSLIDITNNCNISFGGAELKNVDTYNVTVTPRNGETNISGSLQSTFRIKEKTITEDEGAFSVSPETISNQKYDPAGVTLNSINVMDNTWGASKNKQVSLVKDKDYTISYSNNNIATAEASLIISGIGNYNGTVVRKFKIGTDLSNADFSLNPMYYVYNGKSQIPAVGTVTSANGTKLVEEQDYTVVYPSESTNAGTKEIFIEGTGKGYYGKASRSYEIRPMPIGSDDLDVEIDLPRNADGYYTVYTGETIKPNVTVWLLSNGTTLEEGKDYTLEYGENKVAGGKGSVRVKLSGNYSSMTSPYYTFNILPRDDEEGFRIEFVRGTDSYKYDYGNPVKPAVRVYYGTDLLTGGVDYKLPLTYSNNTTPGKGKITAVLQGNYKGTVSEDFKVVGDLKDAKVTDLYASEGYVPTGAEVLPKLSVKFYDDSVLKRGQDYRFTTITPNTGNWATATSATATIEGASDYYTGTTTIRYKLSENGESGDDPIPENPDIPEEPDDEIPEGYTITGVNSTYGYTGSAHRPIPTVTYNGSEQTIEDITYTSSSDGNKCIQAGTVTMKIVVSGNGGDRTLTHTFKITKPINHDTITAYLAPSTYNYTTGGSYRPTVTITDTGLNKTLVLNTDFTVSYENNTAPGVAVARVSGMGDYTGQRALTYTIVDALAINGLTATATSSNSVRLNWVAKTSGVTGYNIRYTGASSGTLTAGATAGSVVVTGLKANSPYTFTVTAVNGNQTGSPATATATTLAGGSGSGSGGSTSTPPTAVSNLAGVSTTAKTAVLSWTVAGDGTRYKIYRSTDGVNYTHVVTMPMNTGTFTDNAANGLTSGTIYYRVRPFIIVNRDYVYGAYSAPIQVTVR